MAAKRRRPQLTARTFALYKARSGTDEEKFWPRVQKGPDCWHWIGSLSPLGYGVLVGRERRHRSAHRLSWEIHYGPIPDGLMVCHHCDNRGCVRPDHLFLGTARDNVQDMLAKGRNGRGWHPVRRGEAHQAARLSDAEIGAIRDAIARGLPHRAIAREFGVSHTYVGKLARGESRVA